MYTTDMITGSHGFCPKFKIAVLATFVKIQPEIGLLSTNLVVVVIAYSSQGIFYNSVP